MVTDPDFTFVSQRELPRMALIRPTLKSEEMVLRAPGMLALHIALDRVEAPCRARVWNDSVAAFDMGELCAQWFSDFLGRPLRLVRFDPERRRIADRAWTGAVEAETAFQDGFPLLVVSARLARRAEPPLSRRAARRRSRSPASARTSSSTASRRTTKTTSTSSSSTRAGGPVRLKLVKPCPRCPIPDVDPDSGEPGHAVGDALAAYRADPRLGGALTFGMNAIVIDGLDRRLAGGQRGRASYRFD